MPFTSFTRGSHKGVLFFLIFLKKNYLEDHCPE